MEYAMELVAIQGYFYIYYQPFFKRYWVKNIITNEFEEIVANNFVLPASNFDNIF